MDSRAAITEAPLALRNVQWVLLDPQAHPARRALPETRVNLELRPNHSESLKQKILSKPPIFLAEEDRLPARLVPLDRQANPVVPAIPDHPDPLGKLSEAILFHKNYIKNNKFCF